MLKQILNFRQPCIARCDRFRLTQPIVRRHNGGITELLLYSTAVSAPRLIYLQNPWSWLSNKMRLKMLKYTWDRDFREDEFIRGVKQATVVLNNHLRSNQLSEIQRITTPKCFSQISKDLQISRNDPRVQMMQFRTHDIRRTIPVRVHFLQSNSNNRHVFIDMFLVGLRRADDMNDAERATFWRHLQSYDQTLDQPKWGAERERFMRNSSAGASSGSDGGGDPVVFAEMYVRFHKVYATNLESQTQWNIAYYKVASFDVLAL